MMWDVASLVCASSYQNYLRLTFKDTEWISFIYVRIIKSYILYFKKLQVFKIIYWNDYNLYILF